MQRSNLKRDHRIIAVPFEPPSQSPAAVSTSISVTRLVGSACVEVEPGRMKATFEISRGVSSSLEVSNVAAPVCKFITLITCSTRRPLHISQFKNERIPRLKFEAFEMATMHVLHSGLIKGNADSGTKRAAFLLFRNVEMGLQRIFGTAPESRPSPR